MTIQKIITLECTGAGASAFLQGQLTCNIHQLSENSPQLTACCNLQGRVIFITTLIKQKERYLLFIPESMQHIVSNHLEKYAKFSKCNITNIGITNFPLASHTQNILNGIPMIYPETSEKIIAQRLNLDVIPDAMSFKKGCYLGQEVLARLHFKGQLKHRLYLGEVTKNNLNYGMPVTDAQQQVTGIIIDFFTDHHKTFLLYVNDIKNPPAYVENQVITAHPLPYDTVR